MALFMDVHTLDGPVGMADAAQAHAADLATRIDAILVEPGQAVKEGQVICIVEAMKMENEVRAPHGGVVAQLSVAAGELLLAPAREVVAAIASLGLSPRDPALLLRYYQRIFDFLRRNL